MGYRSRHKGTGKLSIFHNGYYKQKGYFFRPISCCANVKKKQVFLAIAMAMHLVTTTDDWIRNEKLVGGSLNLVGFLTIVKEPVMNMHTAW